MLVSIKFDVIVSAGGHPRRTAPWRRFSARLKACCRPEAMTSREQEALFDRAHIRL
jgi:hypothetical protein